MGGKVIQDLGLAFDVGHSSIGWAVLENPQTTSANSVLLVDVQASGVLLFPADDCLASVRRQLRGQRRHARATRRRIERIAKFLLKFLGNKQEFNAAKLVEHLEHYLNPNPKIRALLQGKGHPAPWLLAARVLRGGNLLDWPQLWDVLRWYAHNRGYDDNVPWAREREMLSDQAQQAQEQDRKRQARAIALMKRYGTKSSMAETIFCYLFDEADSGGCDVDPRQVDRLPFFRRYFKEEECIFPRETVKAEVREILNRHRAMIEAAGISADTFIRALLDDWRVLPKEFLGGPKDKDRIWLPKRYGTYKKRQFPDGRVIEERTHAGLLFGQLIPRFENRIVSTCPITFARLYSQYLKTGINEEQWKLLPKSWKAQHYRVEEKLRKEFAPEGKEYLITGELLRKAKIADDLGWRCPYTNDPISGFQLAKGERYARPTFRGARR